MDALWNALNAVNNVLWQNAVLYILLGVGVLFTVWSGFSQFRALTHGVTVIRGRYDDHRDPGAINHFQALSTALSATVGLGNIAGVALAITVGGPGAVFWMWVTGVIGMALKLTEVTQAMMFRDTTDPDNPRGGAMWVCKHGFARLHPALAPLGVFVGGVFCVMLVLSGTLGGNMFQAWNVADINFTYFGIPPLVSGVVLTVGVGIVIIGGIRRIGDFAATVVPFMCGLYLLAGIGVMIAHAPQVPGLLALIVREAFAPSEAVGAFIGGTAGYGFLKGMQRAFFSNEAGQGSAPIAHSAVKTNEPAREGVVAGLEPFIDTICVCTVTAMVILLSGAWNRGPALAFEGGVPPAVTLVSQTPDDDGRYRHAVAPARVLVAEATEARGQLWEGQKVFVVVRGGANPDTGMDHHKVHGSLSGSAETGWTATFDDLTLPEPTELAHAREGVYFDFQGAALTAKAFDRILPGLGVWIVPAVVFLFAFSTIISWSYYVEQGVRYLLGDRAVVPYRFLYCLLVVAATSGVIRTDKQLDLIASLGTGVLLWANIPIMLIFGRAAMREYHAYNRRMKSGADTPHDAPPLLDVIEGKDIR